ncbi:MAG: ComEA family DNA-binding protein [Terracidiphilus sp.]
MRRRAIYLAIYLAMAMGILGAGLLCAPGVAFAEPGVAAKTYAIPPPDARVDINHASLDALMTVPGMTRTWAGRIVRFRPYHSKSDLLEHGVVTSEVYDRIKDYIVAHRKKQ